MSSSGDYVRVFVQSKSVRTWYEQTENGSFRIAYYANVYESDTEASGENADVGLEGVTAGLPELTGEMLCITGSSVDD